MATSIHDLASRLLGAADNAADAEYCAAPRAGLARSGPYKYFAGKSGMVRIARVLDANGCPGVHVSAVLGEHAHITERVHFPDTPFTPHVLHDKLIALLQECIEAQPNTTRSTP